MTSGSNPGKREQAKSMVMYVIVGLFVIWAAILNFGGVFMGYDVRWGNEEKTIALCELKGEWVWDEFYEALKAQFALPYVSFVLSRHRKALYVERTHYSPLLDA